MSATSNLRGVVFALERDMEESRRDANREVRTGTWFRAGAAGIVILVVLAYAGIILGWPDPLSGDPSLPEVVQRGLGLVGLKGLGWLLFREAHRAAARYWTHHRVYLRKQDDLRAYQMLEEGSLADKALAAALLEQNRRELEALESGQETAAEPEEAAPQPVDRSP